MFSMTGFGQAEGAADNWRVRVRMAAVNRRQQDLQIQLPREYAVFEPRIRERLLPGFSRGRLLVTVELEATDQEAGGSGIDRNAAVSAARVLQQLAHELDLTGGVTMEALLRVPGVLRSDGGGTIDEPERVWPLLTGVLTEAFDALRHMQAAEGTALAADCRTRLAFLREQLGIIAAHAPSVAVRHREALTQRMTQALEGVELDEDRLLREVAHFADRSDISEELTRAGLHLDRFEQKMSEEPTPGRLLDFLAQELAREFNTLSVKANDAALSECVVHCKAEVEKIREQVQNIE